MIKNEDFVLIVMDLCESKGLFSLESIRVDSSSAWNGWPGVNVNDATSSPPRFPFLHPLHLPVVGFQHAFSMNTTPFPLRYPGSLAIHLPFFLPFAI